MNLLAEIRQYLANLSGNGMIRLATLPESAPGWVFREGARFGVAVELPETLLVSERFAAASLNSVHREFNGKLRQFLRLESSRETLRNEFAVVCAQFLEFAPAERRNQLLVDPLGWWERWKDLLGNVVRECESYSVLGELLAMERLISKGQRCLWQGPASGSVDLHTSAGGYEVKSTTNRYDSIVHIAGQFQLLTSSISNLYLIHQRFEPSDVGECVDSTVDRLVGLGVPRDDLELGLERLGLEPGRAARRECYRLLESRIFRVDDNFPKITPASFHGGTMPNGIVQIQYDVDLATLHSVVF
jgi:hypothetical protein